MSETKEDKFTIEVEVRVVSDDEIIHGDIIKVNLLDSAYEAAVLAAAGRIASLRRQHKHGGRSPKAKAND